TKPSRPELPVGEALLFPRVGFVVVAVPLPEAGLVVRNDLERADPFRALPEVTPRHDEPERPPVLGRELLAVMPVREQSIILVQFRDREIGGEPALRVDYGEATFALHPRTAQHLPDGNSLPQVVVSAPARHAMDVAPDLHARERTELLPRPPLRPLDE